jgi:tryptophan-rich sensory protein
MERTPPRAPWLGLIAFVTVCFVAAGVGGMVTSSNTGDWYARLAKPSWNAPSWVFGPVWSALYLSMAVAAWLVWRQGGWAGAALPLTMFGAQLVLNVLWSVLFFGLHSPGVAFGEVLALWALILATTVLFWQRSRTAGALFVPYLAWVSFAAVLNFTIWRLNA